MKCPFPSFYEGSVIDCGDVVHGVNPSKKHFQNSFVRK